MIQHNKIKISKIELSLFLIAMLITWTMIYYLGASITSFVIKEFSYADDVNLVITSNGNYTWQLKNIGELKSLKIDGRVTNYGRAIAYLESNGIKYLIFDSSKMNDTASVKNGSVSLITAFANKETKEDKDNGNKSSGNAGDAANSDEEKKKSNKKPKWVDEDKFIVNGTTLINLSEHFIDEDNNSLTYSASQADGFAVSVNKEIVTITPLSDNEFNATITFTASDGIDSKSHSASLIVIAQINLFAPEKIIANVTANITTNETINQTITKSINLSLSYNSGTIYDANDNGEESINGVVDLTIEDTKLSWNADKAKICTRWEIYNIEDGILTKFCNGNADCCAFFGLKPKNEQWNGVYYSSFNKDGAGHNNIISAQVVYYDVNLTLGSSKSEIYNSTWNNLSVKFFNDESKFSGICMDTCALSGLNKSSYTLVFEIENDAVLRIDKISYAILADVVNAPPLLLKNISNVNIAKNKNATINLSEYFADPDGDALAYSYYKADNLTILFENSTATILPDKEFEGVRFTYLIANDSENYIVSNLFMVNVSSFGQEPANITLNISSNATFEIRDKEDNKLALIDMLGNLKIKGALTQNTELFADSNDFAIQNLSGGLNMVITNPEGNLQIKGTLNEAQGILTLTPNSFIIQNLAGETLAYVNSTGSLFLRGALRENATFN